MDPENAVQSLKETLPSHISKHADGYVQDHVRGPAPGPFFHFQDDSPLTRSRFVTAV